MPSPALAHDMVHDPSRPAETCIHRLFEIQAERAPDAVAVSFGDGRLTYGELNRRANQLAHHLRSLGVGPEVLVALCVERSLDAVVGLFGVLKAGGAYVPIDPTYPRERIAFMLEDAGAPVLLTQARLLPSLPHHEARVVLLDGDREAIARCSDEDPPPEAGPDHLAYVIYTSGSTGRPKGAMLAHRGVVNLALAEQELFGVGPGHRVLQLASLSFDASVWELLMALVTGATLIMVPRAVAVPGPDLLAMMRAEEVSVATFMASVLAALPEGAEDSLPALRTVIVSGEACHADLAERWAPGRRFFNVYGPTEASCVTTVAEYARDGAAPPIGTPIQRSTCFVLDAALRPVPRGTPGELYIGGVGVGRGYLSRPALTAARFVPDPFTSIPGGRLYRTGDMVRERPDGQLEFLGRTDHQVKIRGHRVELGEIEAVLGRHPAVRATAAIVRSDAPHEAKLVAYVVPRSPERGDGAVVPRFRSFLRDRLPEVMIPSAFVLLDALPLTPSGKIDRAALPAPGPCGAEGDDERKIASPRGATEATIAAVWAEALGLAHIGVDEDVFDLGGHSLLVARVLSRLRRAFGVELPLQRLFEARTVAALTAVVEVLLQDGRRAPAEAIRSAPRDRPLPLSSGQRQVWLHARLHPGALFYNEPFSLRLPGPLHAPTLARALDEVLRRHEAWRTTFVEVDGEPVQRIHPPAPFELPIVDLSAAPGPERWERALALATEEARRPFDLERGPLFRAVLVRLDESEHVLFFTLHHLLLDGVSLYDVFAPELWAIYQAFSMGKPSPLPELPIQYADYAVWQRQQLDGAAIAPHLQYWREKLAGLPTLELPTDRPRPVMPSLRGARHCLALDRDLTLKLKDLAREQGVTLFVVLLAAFKALLLRHARQDEIVVGTSSSSRDRPELEPLLGFFLNSLVLRTDMRGDPSFRELLGRVGAVSREALAHQAAPFTTVVEALQPRRTPGQNPLFQAAFILEPPVPATGSGWTLSQLDVDIGASKFDLTLELDERPSGIIGRIEYSADLFDASTIARMADHYGVLLEGAVADPDRPLSALPVLTPAERRSLLEWGSAPPGPGANECIHRLFEDQAERSPDATALVFDDGAGGVLSLTYGELNRRANQLAHHLLRTGAALEGRAAVCMYRSPEMIVAILGALKAGLAFVPLDPVYPTDRLSFMLDQARAGVVLTQVRIGEALSGRGARIICLDTGWDEIAAEPDDNPAVPAWPDQLAYVIFTSGSTGRPKGVAVPHRGVARLVKGTDYASFAREEVFLQLASISFDTAQFEIWGALLNGGRLVVMPPTLASLEDLGRVIREHGVTTAWLTSGVFHVLVDERTADLRALRQIVAGGDVVSPQHVNRVLEEIPGCRMVNGYGPTEAATFACCFTALRPAGHTVPIGRPIPGTRVHVLDERLREVPVGIPGELYIGGEGLARCYFGRPDLTAERFVPDPIGVEPGARLYRTGDRVRWMPDGQIEFLGRLDHQVKVRGYRIELGEIEAVIGSHPAVRDVVATVRPDRSGDRRLVAYVVTHPGADMPGGVEQAIRDYLLPRLPEYMIPSAILQLDALPLTTNGKVDRRALPVPDEARPAAGPVVAPRSDVERRLASIWQDLLGIPRVGVHDNFFDLGGHSLLLMRLHERIRDAFSSDLTMIDIFARPTISDLAMFLSSDRREDDLSAADARARKQRETLKRKKLAAAQAKSKQYGPA